MTPVLLPALTLGRHVIDRTLTPREAAAALDDLRALDVERHGYEALLDRVWALRDNLTAYEAVFVALAEALGTTVLTCDRKLARAPGTARRIVLVSWRSEESTTARAGRLLQHRSRGEGVQGRHHRPAAKRRSDPGR